MEKNKKKEIKISLCLLLVQEKTKNKHNVQLRLNIWEVQKNIKMLRCRQGLKNNEKTIF